MFVVYGGTSMNRDLNAFKNDMPDVLVATPGRLNDHLENHGAREGENDSGKERDLHLQSAFKVVKRLPVLSNLPRGHNIRGTTETRQNRKRIASA